MVSRREELEAELELYTDQLAEFNNEIAEATEHRDDTIDLMIWVNSELKRLDLKDQ